MRTLRPAPWLLLAAAALACGGASKPGSGPDAGAVDLRPCPGSGPGAVVGAGTCNVFSPVSAGASSLGQNAARLNYALEPSVAPSGLLVLLLNGSGGSPGQMAVDARQNVPVAAAEAGNHVLAVAYRSDLAVAQLCGSRPGCYGATRATLITGVFHPGADASLGDIREDEGILTRVDQALRALDAARPGAGWGVFRRDPAASAAADRIAWTRIVAAGHSQGGGHAAYLAKLFPVSRVVQFASTCDAPSGVPAPWTAADSGWVTSPAAAFYGLSAPTVFTGDVPTGGDLNCPYHLAVWQALGMDPSRQADDAATCAVGTPHGAPIACSANYPRWVALFQ
jgi:hypothetical protein